MAVEALAWKLSGCLVRELEPEGLIQRDGRIKSGDLLVSVNQESLWRVTSSRAREILERTHRGCDTIR